MNPVTAVAQASKRLWEKHQLRLDYIETFSTPHGERVLADILAKSGVTRPQFNADPYVTQFNEGHRHMALSVFRQVHGSIDRLPGLIAEELKKMEQNQEEQPNT